MRKIFAPMSALALLAAVPASGQVTVRQVTTETDSSNQAAWWRPIVVKGSTTYLAWNAPGSVTGNHEVKVGISVNDGAWTIGSLRNANGTLWLHDDDIGHDQPTIAVDGDGYIHVWADHHNDGWRYFRSSAPGDVSDIRRVEAGTAGAMPGTGQFTYPIAEHAPNGDVYLIIRNNGNGFGAGELYRFNNGSNSWSYITQFAREAGHYVYPDDLKVDGAGNVHIAFEWAWGKPRPLRHYGSYLRYEPGSNGFRLANGSTPSLPVTRTTPGLLYQGLSAGETWSDTDIGIGIQAAGLAVDSQNRPSIAYRYRTDGGSEPNDFDVYRIRWDGAQWTNRTRIFTANNNVPAAVETMHNGTRARVYFTVTGQGLMGAESTSNYAVRPLASGQPGISRISVVQRSTSTDSVYAAAPTEISADRGRLYVVQVGASLP